MRRGQAVLWWLGCCAWVLASGCGGCEEDTGEQRPDSGGMPDMVVGDMGGDVGEQPVDMGGDAAQPDSGDMLVVPVGCEGDGDCGRGERCGEEGMCELASCDVLDCGALGRCEAVVTGGAECVDNQCQGSAQCPEERFCGASGVCELDVCVASVATCDASGALTVCADDGGGVLAPLACPLACDDGGGDAFCACRDDWECPTFMRCDVGRCRGSGQVPECTLPPVPFEEAKPTLELSWGTYNTTDWANPYPTMTSVAMSTMVANLDDDNGDGVINELDFPDIIYVSTYRDTPAAPINSNNWSQRGVLRVMRGGGPRRGEQMLAICDGRVWRAGDEVSEAQVCDLSVGMHFRSYGSIAVGDLDGDGTPEIVTLMQRSTGSANNVTVRIYSPRGELLVETSELNTRDGGVGVLAVGLADLDGDGMSEVMVGAAVISLERDVQDGTWRHVETLLPQAERLNIACIADLASTPGQEVYDNLVLWRKPSQPGDRATRAECDGSEVDEAGAWCRSELVPVWDKRDELRSRNNANNKWRGSCAIADVLNANGEGPRAGAGLDGVPEIVLIGEEELIILRASDGEVLRRQDLNGLMGSPPPARIVINGGPPNIDDFDGDGFPEIGTAFGRRYAMIDLQPAVMGCEEWTAGDRAAPAQACSSDAMCGEGFFCDRTLSQPACRCLHNSWVKVTEDDSSSRTGSSVFDFNGDGAAEVIYNDECFFRIYDGRDGSTLFEQPSEHITNVEYPVIADVDNDGNAEIIFSMTEQGTRCSIRNELDPVTGQPYRELYNSGVQVWGDANDAWVSARRIWNQHAYHVTNVYEDGQLPREFVPNWTPSTQGLLYNVYRSNPRSLGLAPDLTISDVRLSSPQAGCGAVTTTLLITGRVRNEGELRVGPGVALIALGQWADGRRKVLRDAQGVPIHVILSQSVEPSRSVRFELLYDALADSETEPPVSVELVINPDLVVFDGTAVVAQSERECRDDNNRVTVAVEERALPDLRLASLAVDTGACPLLSLSARVVNEGSAPVLGLRVTFYAGAPDLGGQLIAQVDRAEPLLAGQEATVLVDANLEALRLVGFPIVVYAVVEPLGGEDECNLSNNVLGAAEPKFCVPG